MRCLVVPKRFWHLKGDATKFEPGFLYGKAGRGKTHMAVRMSCFAAPGGARYVSVPEYVSEMRELAIDDTDERWYDAKRIKESKQLILDDLGGEKLTEFAFELLYGLLDYRWGNELATLVTSNLTPDELSRVHGDRIASRVLGFGRIRELTGRDIRLDREPEEVSL